MSIFSSMFGGGTPKSAELEKVLHANPELEIEHKGDVDSFDFRVNAKNKNQGEVSLWHDIKLFPTDDSKQHNIVNMVNEVSFHQRKQM